VPRLGHAFSAHGLAGTLGWAFAPVFLAGIATIAGWRVALLAASALAFIVLAALAAFRDLLDPREVQNAVVKSPRGASGSILGFMSAPVWMCFAFFLISSFSFGGIQSFAPAALRDIYEIPFALATACITAYMLASAGGIVAGGFLATRTAHHDKVVAAGFAASGAIAVVVATGVPPAASVIVLLGLIGFGAGIAGPSRDLLVRAAAPKNATGRVYGVVYSGLDIGLSIAPTLFGLVMDWQHPSWVFIGIGLFQVLALFAALGVGGTTIKRGMQTA
jgi:MFS family permease